MTAITQPSQQTKKKRPLLLYVLGGMMTVFLGIIAVFAILLWWSQRPIKPTILTAHEKSTLNQKLEVLSTKPGEMPPEVEPDRFYTPGSHTLQLSEREINGLLNENTDLGQKVRLEFGRDAINAYIAAPIPDDVPMVGGKMFRARGRFKLSLAEGQAPVALLEDVTIYGVSLPKAWLGGLKGENLLKDAFGDRNGDPLIKGVKSLRIQPGAIVLELEE